MHLLRQDFLGLLRHRLLRYLGHRAVARSVTLRSSGAGVVDGVGDFLFDALGEFLLEFLGHDAAAYGVGLVCSLRHDGRLGWLLKGAGDDLLSLSDEGDGGLDVWCLCVMRNERKTWGRWAWFI